MYEFATCLVNFAAESPAILREIDRGCSFLTRELLCLPLSPNPTQLRLLPTEMFTAPIAAFRFNWMSEFVEGIERM